MVSFASDALACLFTVWRNASMSVTSACRNW